ncbi:MAG: hypothetical protein SFV51_08865 [Bryobacteraceae bacterium]|nr:hypothetical protein [Bryobacteraceae bacterium]
MDLRVYYRKIREVESGLPGEFVVLVSQETADGGKAGVMTEVPRYSAAKLIVENRARLATETEARAFRGEPLEAGEADSAVADAVVEPVRTKARKD